MPLSVAEAITAHSGVRILCCDIETRPGTAYYWHPKTKYIGAHMSITKPALLCFDAKWYGEPDHIFMSEWDDGPEAMVAKAHDLLDEADWVVGYNSRGFDVKHLYREMLQAGKTPPSPHKDIDLIEAARRKFAFPYRSLNEICSDLGLSTKLEHEGFELWVAVMDGDPEAQERMRAYNIQDVVILEELYDRLRPWIPNHPNLNMWRTQRVSGCDRCASVDLEDAGYYYTKTRAYAQFRCRSCGAHTRATHHEPSRASYRTSS